jgi:hypothetical protein
MMLLKKKQLVVEECQVVLLTWAEWAEWEAWAE